MILECFFFEEVEIHPLDLALSSNITPAVRGVDSNLDGVIRGNATCQRKQAFLIYKE